MVSKSNLYKIIIPLLFVLAIGLGLIRREKTETFEFNNSTGNLQDELLSYYKTGQNSAQNLSPQKSTVNFLAVGDIMLSRKVAKEMDQNDDWLLPYSQTQTWLSSVDFVFGNLESPFNGSEYYNPGETLIFNAPLKTIEGLKLNNFKVLQLANNHAFDQGKKGLDFTQNLLNEFGIKYIGTGSTTVEAFKPAIIEQNGLKICFIGASYASINDSGKTRNDYLARIDDLENLKSSILNHKSSCDFIVASMHAGTEYTHEPNKAQITFAHAAIDYGADMVIGHHPHWIQTIERYCPNSTTTDDGTNNCSNAKYIFYSLGNFIFDQMWSQKTKEGLALKITLSKNACHPGNLSASESYPGSSASSLDSGSKTKIAQSACGNDLQGPRVPATLEQIELLPVIIENYSTPRAATPEETKKILQKIGEPGTILK